MSLQHRVTRALVALVALFVLMLAGLGVMTLRDQDDELVDARVQAEARRLALRLDGAGPHRLQPDDLVELPPPFLAWWIRPGVAGGPATTKPARPLPDGYARLSPGPHRIHEQGVEWRIVVSPLRGGARLLLAYDPREDLTSVQQFAVYVGALAVLFIGLAVLLSWQVAGWVAEPLQRVTRLLESWVGGGDAASMPTPAKVNEEDRLLDAFRRVQARWEQGLAQEREFMANLRHELRTPLTALRTDLEMLGLGPFAHPGQAQRVQRGLAAVDAVTDALASVQALHGGAGGPQASSDLALAPCVEDAWASLGDWPTRSGLTLRNQVPADARLRADRHALLTILRNLMRNAAEHAAPACCTVGWTTHGGVGCIWLEDDGPGLPAGELPFVFERYWRGRLRDAPTEPGLVPSERGLGLAIARQLAEGQGWQLEAGAAPSGRGLRFALRGPMPASK